MLLLNKLLFKGKLKIGIIGIGNVGLQVLKDIQSNDKINNF